MVTSLRWLRLSYSALLAKHATNRLVGAPLKWVIGKKDLLLCVHVVVKPVTLGRSRRFEVYLFSQSDHCFVRLCLSSWLKLPSAGTQQITGRWPAVWSKESLLLLYGVLLFFFFCAREFGSRVKKKKVDFVALSLSCVDNCDARGCDYENKKHV